VVVWDCMQWWNSVGNGTVSWLTFLPMMLWPIVVIGGIVALVMLLTRSEKTETKPNWRSDSRRQSPFEILRERFARGKIDRQEYEERTSFLSQR
jgi:putative membrane protein